jgi:hypothetical protein
MSLEQVSFKQRAKRRIKRPKLIYGDVGFIILKEVQFEYTYFNNIKRFLKYFFKLKYSLVNNLKVWVFLKANFPISRKSKNSRMGKGKGSFIGWNVKLSSGHSLIEFKNVNHRRVNKLRLYWNQFLNFYITLICRIW